MYIHEIKIINEFQMGWVFTVYNILVILLQLANGNLKKIEKKKIILKKKKKKFKREFTCNVQS